MKFLLFSLLFLATLVTAPPIFGKVTIGADRAFEKSYAPWFSGKRIGLITNQTGITSSGKSTIQFFLDAQGEYKFKLVRLFAPEHGLQGELHAGEKVPGGMTYKEIPVVSLYGATRKPTALMLKGIDLLVFDIQDIGYRSYTFASTLFYVMEAAAQEKIPVVVLDRPNPMGGMVVDGPMLEDRFRSFVGYINTPYAHGMTVGELARFFNGEYKINCQLKVLPMSGWKRTLSFEKTGLSWIPTSPNIPDAQAAICYGITGILGELSLVDIGIGNTCPFRLIVAPWIEADRLIKILNQRPNPGVQFVATHYKPYSGQYKGVACHGVLIIVTDPINIRPVTTCWSIVDALKRLYPKQMSQAMKAALLRKDFFCKITGTAAVWEALATPAPFQKLTSIHSQARTRFTQLRQKYLLYPL